MNGVCGCGVRLALVLLLGLVLVTTWTPSQAHGQEEERALREGEGDRPREGEEHAEREAGVLEEAPCVWSKTMRKIVSVLAGSLLVVAVSAAVTKEPVVLVFDPNTTHQKMEGLEATVPWNPIWTKTKPQFPSKGFIAERHENVKGRQEPVPAALMNQILDAAVFGLGLTRLRLEVGPYMEKGNDSGDPGITNLDGFYFSWLDCCVEEMVLPIKERIEKRGDRLVLTVSYAIENWETPKWLQDPREYAEFARTVLTHLREKYKLIPDYWVLGNESRMGHSAMVILGKWLKKEGFATRFAFPEAVNLQTSVETMNELNRKYPQAAAFIGQVTYHIYGKGGNPERHKLRDWAKGLGVTTAMTEKIGAGPDQLYLDLTEADVAAWQRYSLVWFGDEPGEGTYFMIQPDHSGFLRSHQYWELRQYFHYIRPGAMRVNITSSDTSVKPVAFLSPKGNPVVVILNRGGACQARIRGLPDGRYMSSFSAAGQPGKELLPVDVAAGLPVAIGLPGQSVLTLTADPQ